MCVIIIYNVNGWVGLYQKYYDGITHFELVVETLLCMYIQPDFIFH